MNHTITKNGNDFKVDPLLEKARREALGLKSISRETAKGLEDYLEETRVLEFPMLKGKKDEI